jgi:hypothetical protein
MQIRNHSAADTLYFDRVKKDQLKYVLFDKGNNVLKKETLNTPATMLLQQAAEADFQIDRLRALDALEPALSSDYAPILKQCMSPINHFSTQAKAFMLLLSIDSTGAWLTAFAIRNPDFWNAIIPQISNWPPQYRPQLEALLEMPSYQLQAAVLERLCIQFPKDAQTYLQKMKGVSGNSGNNVKVKTLLLQYAFLKDREAAVLLADMCSNSFDFLTRINAIKALQAVNFCNEEAVKGMVQGIFKSNWKLASEMGKALKEYHKTTYKTMIHNTIAALPMTPEQRRRIEKLLAD